MRVRLAVLAMLAAALPAQATDGPVVTNLSGTAYSGNRYAFIQGTAEIFGENPVTLGTDTQGDATPSALGLSGTDARAIAVWREASEPPSLTFALSLFDLQAVLPETNAWRWTFQTRGATYRLEALLGGLTGDGTLEAPLGALGADDPSRGSFRLLGPCTPQPSEPFEDMTCPLIARLSGQIDANADRILWSVPVGTGGLFEDGDTIAPATAGATAEFRVGPQRYRDEITQTGTYTLQPPRVLLGVQLTSQFCPPNCPDPNDATLTSQAWASQSPGTNSFEFVGLVDLAGYPRGGVFARAVAQACIGTLCGPRATFDIRI